jgi:hypothetical protein
MVCVTIPTQDGYNEMKKFKRSYLNELEEASNILKYETKLLDKAN